MLLFTVAASAGALTAECPEPGWTADEQGDCRHEPVATTSRARIRGTLEERAIENDDGMLFVPRLVLTPARLAALGVMLPVRYGALATERAFLHGKKAGEPSVAGIAPALLYETGLGFGAGLSFAHTDLFGNDERLSIGARLGGRYLHAYQLQFAADRVAGLPAWTDVTAGWESTPNVPFYGTGAESAAGRARDASYYSATGLIAAVGAGPSFDIGAFRLRPGLQNAFARRTFDSTPRNDSLPGVDPAEIVGFSPAVVTDEVQAVLSLASGNLDGLRPGGTETTLAVGQSAVGAWPYQRASAEFTASIPVWRGDRIVSFRALHESVFGDEDAVPFATLPMLGGADRMLGIREGRLRGRHATMAGLAYTYPVHANVAGRLFVNAGSAVDDPSQASDLSAWRASGGGGLSIGSDDGVGLRLDIAGGDGFWLFFGTDLANAFLRRPEAT